MSISTSQRQNLSVYAASGEKGLLRCDQRGRLTKRTKLIGLQADVIDLQTYPILWDPVYLYPDRAQ